MAHSGRCGPATDLGGAVVATPSHLRRKAATWIALLWALLLGASAGRAESDPGATGPELRLSGTVGVLTSLADRVEDTSNFKASALAGVDLDSEPSIGFNAEGGYRIHPWVSIAAHVEHLPEISISTGNRRAGPQAGSGVLKGESWALTADARLFPLTGRVQPFLVLGAGWLWVHTDDERVVQTSAGEDPMLEPIDSGLGNRDGFVARAGGGVDLYLTDAFFLSAQVTYVVPVDRVQDFDYVSVAWGFGYQF